MVGQSHASYLLFNLKSKKETSRLGVFSFSRQTGEARRRMTYVFRKEGMEMGIGIVVWEDSWPS